jgi:hypothetical protein
MNKRWLALLLVLLAGCFESRTSPVGPVGDSMPPIDAFENVDLAPLPDAGIADSRSDGTASVAITALIPGSWPLGGPSLTLAIEGHSLAGATARLGGTTIPVTTLSPSHLLATISSGFAGFALPGTATLKLTAADGTVVTAPFTVTPPAVVPVFPWPTSEDLVAVAALGPGEWATGTRSGQIFRHAGGGWVPFGSVPGAPTGISGSPTAFFVSAVVSGGGTITSFLGNTVTTEASLSQSVASVAASPDGLAIACGPGGMIWLRHSKNGVSWVPMTSGTTQALNAVAAVSANLAYAVGTGGAALKWDGNQWLPLATLPTTADLYAVAATLSGSVFVGGASGALWSSGDGGATWNQVSGVPPQNVTAVDAVGDYVAGGQLFAVGSSSGIAGFAAVSSDGARGLGVGSAGAMHDLGGSGVAVDARASAFQPQALWVDPSSGQVFAAASTGLWRYDSATSTATDLGSGPAATPTSTWGSSPSSVYVAGGGVARFDGTSLTTVDADPMMTGVFGVGAADVYAWGADGLHHSADGTTFADAGLTGAVTAVWGSGPTDVWVAQGTQLLHGSATAGFSADGTLPLAATALSGSGPTDVVAVGGTSMIAVFDGTQWNAITTPAPVIAITSIAAADAIALGSGGVAYELKGGVVTALPAMAALPDLSSVSAASAQDIWISSAQGAGGLFQLAR